MTAQKEYALCSWKVITNQSESMRKMLKSKENFVNVKMRIYDME